MRKFRPGRPFTKSASKSASDLTAADVTAGRKDACDSGIELGLKLSVGCVQIEQPNGHASVFPTSWRNSE
jgi:hypothetical protein